MAVLWVFYGAKNENKTANPNSSPVIFKEEKNDKADPPTGQASSTPPIPDESAQINKYENAQYGFSFNYPLEFTIREFPEDEDRVALIIQNEKTDKTVQIYITSYDDQNFVVSAERIRSDIPDLPFSNSADVVMGGKAKGVAFFSENEAFGGPTAEIWFADGKLFYQATASAKNAGELEEIIKSWKFR